MEQQFSDNFLDLAYYAVLFSNIDSENDRNLLAKTFEICKKHGVSMKTYLDIVSEITEYTMQLKPTEDTPLC